MNEAETSLSLTPKTVNNWRSLPRKHGQAKRGQHTPEYRAWYQMKSRCQRPANPGFKDYGGRGIKVCERWMVFSNFFADMGPRPTKGHSLGRKDNDGNYCPENCRWETPSDQGSNKRTTRFITFNGQTMTMKQWAAKIGLKYPTLQGRINFSGWSIERALTGELQQGVKLK